MPNLDEDGEAYMAREGSCGFHDDSGKGFRQENAGNFRRGLIHTGSVQGLTRVHATPTRTQTRDSYAAPDAASCKYHADRSAAEAQAATLRQRRKDSRARSSGRG